jgi:hypothetical protein
MLLGETLPPIASAPPQPGSWVGCRTFSEIRHPHFNYARVVKVTIGENVLDP